MRLVLAILLASGFAAAQDVASLVHRALGPNIAPHASVKPLTADFTGDGHPDLAVAVDFNKQLATWLRRGDVILDLDSPALTRLRPDNDPRFCFGLLILDGMDATRKTVFYGCFTGWRLIRAPGGAAKGAALDLDMDDGVRRLYFDGMRYRTRLITSSR